MEKLQYEPTEVERPQLFEEMFPYDNAPKMVFEENGVAIDLPDAIWVTDTTLRDGQQSMRAFSAAQSEQIFRFLHEIDNGTGIIRSAEFFVYSDNDREALERCQVLGYTFPEVTTWIRASKKDFDIIKDLGVKETGLLMSCSDYHIFKKLSSTRLKTMQNYLDVAQAAFEKGITPRCHLEDMTRADIFGFVVPLVKNLCSMAQSYNKFIRFRVCDTLGVALPYDKAALPRGVAGLMRVMREECGLSSAQIEWHGHNDFHKAVANSTAAWLYGASGVNTTLLGIGERSGNTHLEAMLFEYLQLKGKANLNLKLLKEVEKFFSLELGYDIHRKHPLIGADFNTTKAGIHADGLLKDPQIYNSFDTKALLDRPIVIMVNQASGCAGVAGWINNYYHLSAQMRLSKHDAGVEKIRDWVETEYAAGRTSAITNEEMRAQVKLYYPAIEQQFGADNMAFVNLD